MTGEQITTLADLMALPSNSVILDSMGDPGLVGLEGVTYRESSVWPLDYVAKYFLPATVLYRPDAEPVPSPAEVAEGVAQAIEKEAEHYVGEQAAYWAVVYARIAREYPGGAS